MPSYQSRPEQDEAEPDEALANEAEEANEAEQAEEAEEALANEVDDASANEAEKDGGEESQKSEGGDSGEEVMFTAEEVRVLGCLMEKEQTTPEYYPLTMNAVVAACNQRSNRNPVVEFDDGQVEDAIERLRERGFAALISVAGSRVPKFKHTLDLALPALEERGKALLTVLLLRGQQTLGELRTRTERMFHFGSLEAVQESLESLENYPGRKLVCHLPAGGGRRVPTYLHLMGADASITPASPAPTASAVTAAPATPSADWRGEIEEAIGSLREQVAALRKELDEFKSQFG